MGSWADVGDNDSGGSGGGGGAPSGPATGSLGGSYPGPSLSTVATAGTTGDASLTEVGSAVLTAEGRVTSLVPVAVGAGAGFWEKACAKNLGINSDIIVFDYYPFSVRGGAGTTQVTASGGSSGAGTKVLRLANGATAGGLVANFLSPSSGATQIQAGSGASFLWWIAGRFALNAAVAAGNACGLIASSNVTSGAAATPTLVVGAYGPSSTAHWVLFGTSGTFIDSGINVDTNAHTFIAWYDGTNTWFQVDGNAPVSGTARPGADSYVGVMSYGAAITTNNQVSISWMAFGTNRP